MVMRNFAGLSHVWCCVFARAGFNYTVWALIRCGVLVTLA